ncbi:virulence-associated protein E [Altererythrobacter oceanensis]|uniref:Virulence-associated protein E n=1 Tax=Qipengyuania oceanensis TaxID=1463597 RepID=A0A844YI63_9SPHN|nr:virulence-associated protein E [Qipengyuania oceanensis]
MGLLDLDTIRRAHPLPQVVAGVVKLQRAGSEWKACCPLHNDRSPSFTIFDGGNRFQCFGCGAHGDVLDFIQQLHGVGLREAAAMLSGGDLPTVEVVALPSVDDASDRVEEARSIWRNAGPVAGTVGAAYLRSRGITIDPPLSLRFTMIPYGRSGPAHPCLVCCVSSPDGPLQGIQRIYLAPDGKGKADLPSPKLSLGRVRGGAIRLAPLDGGEVVVAEGPETGLSLLQVLRRPVWVACGTVMLPAIQFPATVRSVAIGGDNDDAGRAAASKAATEFANRGLSTRVFFPACRGDFNDLLMEAA